MSGETRAWMKVVSRHDARIPEADVLTYAKVYDSDRDPYILRAMTFIMRDASEAISARQGRSALIHGEYGCYAGRF